MSWRNLCKIVFDEVHLTVSLLNQSSIRKNEDGMEHLLGYLFFR